MYIYKITNNLNNKIYIGLKTSSVEESESYYGSGILINQVIDKYGIDNFTKTILERDITDYDYLQEREQYWIEYYDSYKNGYNMTLGGDGSLGRVVSEETRKKLSKALKGKYKGRVMSKEHKEKISESMQGRIVSEETRKNLSKALKGKYKGENVSEETRKNLSKAMRNVHKNSPILTCPHCGKQGKKSTGHMTRFHFDNCKHKP